MWKNIKNCKKCGKTFVSLAMLKTLPCDKIKSFVKILNYLLIGGHDNSLSILKIWTKPPNFC